MARAILQEIEELEIPMTHVDMHPFGNTSLLQNIYQDHLENLGAL